jgi:23S rRNA (guanosine2251-2'-O)-methyltransferase
MVIGYRLLVIEAVAYCLITVHHSLFTKQMTKDQEITYGMRPVMEAIESGKTIDKVLFQKGLQGELFKQLFYEVRQRKIPFQYVPQEKLNRLTRQNHQGVVAFLSAIEYCDIYNIVPSIFEEGRVPFLLLLDKITDVRNVGAIARSAECAGVDAIILPLNGGAQLNEDAVKSSAGALHKVPVCRHSNLVEVIQYLKDSGIEVIGVTEKANHAHYNKDFTGPVCLIMGNEYEGIAWDYLKHCNDTVTIPMVGTIRSLNVSVATGIALFEVVKQRNPVTE